jgi:hypothetical protein
VPELAVIAGVVALIYGPSKLPELGKGLGWCRRSLLAARCSLLTRCSLSHSLFFAYCSSSSFTLRKNRQEFPDRGQGV